MLPHKMLGLSNKWSHNPPVTSLRKKIGFMWIVDKEYSNNWYWFVTCHPQSVTSNPCIDNIEIKENNRINNEYLLNIFSLCDIISTNFINPRFFCFENSFDNHIQDGSYISNLAYKKLIHVLHNQTEVLIKYWCFSSKSPGKRYL